MTSDDPTSTPERPRDPERARTAAERARKAERARQVGESTPEAEARRQPRKTARAARAGRLVGHWLRDAFVENFALKLVAFFLALGVFVLVQSDEDVEISVYVSVAYVVPEDRVLVSEPVERVRLTVAGTRRQIQGFDERSVERVHIDVADRQSGELFFTPDMFDIPEGLRIVAITPTSTVLHFEPRDQKKVPIEVTTVGEAAAGHVVEDVRVTPDEVIVSGANSAVAGVETVKTREIALDERASSFEDTVPLVDPHPQLEVLGDRFVRVEIDIEKQKDSQPLGRREVTLQPESGLPADAAAGFRAEPGEVEVTLRGAAAALQPIDPNDITVVVEVDEGDLEAGQARSARLQVDGVPEGVAAETEPQEVTLHPPEAM